MRTTHRIAKKQASRFAVRAVSLPYVLGHAKLSLYALPFGTMRYYVYRTLIKQTGANARTAKLVAWRWAQSQNA